MVKTYHCPNCGGAMVFNAELGNLVCEHCDTIKTAEELEALNEHQEVPVEESIESETFEQFRHYHCSTCGAEILTDEYTIATFCNFCGNPTLMENQVSGELRPTKVIPFKISKQQVMEQCKAWSKKSLFTPKEFSNASVLEKITGTYVPYWLYDLDVDMEMSARCTKVRRTRTGDMEHTYTDHFEVQRKIKADYRKIPADASKKMDDKTMSYLEPFDYQGLKEFEMPYLSGFLAEKYQFTSDQLVDQVKSRALNYATSSCRDTIQGYSSVNVVNQSHNIQRRKSDYVLFPVWILVYRYQGKDYVITVNGQTSKLIGKLPVSKGSMLKWFGIISAATFAVLTILGGLLSIGGIR